MKATIEFTLPEEDDAFRTAVNALEYRATVNEIMMAVRDKLKYCELTDDQHSIVQELYDRFHEIVRENNVEWS